VSAPEVGCAEFVPSREVIHELDEQDRAGRMSTAAVNLAKAKAPGFWGSTNGKKAVMAVTGAILFIFVIGHLAGNLQVFEGPAKLNAYGKLLHDLGELLWPVRILLLICVTLHIVATVQLALLKKRARPVGYSAKKAIASSYASRTMYWSGPIVLAFVIFHLLHLTAGYIHPGAAFSEGDVYHNVVAGFQVWWVSVWYIFSIILLGLHLRHGIWSMFQSLGMNHPRHTPILKSAAWVIALVIVLGYISIPISILLGMVK
jgi:succinate dehydrogenase / fumarate reductase, cytochrome b subunit